MKRQMHQLQEVPFVSSQVNIALKYSLEAVGILLRVSAVKPVLQPHVNISPIKPPMQAEIESQKAGPSASS